MNFASNFSELLTAFNKYQVNYMVVGGYAVNFHGYVRTTSDLDIWVKPGKENLLHIVEALRSLQFDEDSLQHVMTFDSVSPFLFHVGDKPDDVEVFNFVTGLKYEDAEPHKVPFSDEGGINVHFIGVRDLIVNKMLAGRLQDKADVDMLQKIQKLQ